jgi:preprotein translocase subunit SecF
MTFSFIGRRRLWFALSGGFVALSVAALLAWGLRFGVDFTGGSLLELRFPGGAPTSADVAALVAESGFGSATAQPAGDDGVILRLRSLSEDEHQRLRSEVAARFGEAEELRFNSIGPVIGEELRRGAVLGVGATLLLIGLYIAWAFRKVSDPVPSWKYAALTVAAAAHDVIIPLGLFAFMGRFHGWEVNAPFVAAALTILGYSISDTVVVFDRTRENLQAMRGKPFSEVAEASVRQTFVRSLNTSLTTLLALAAIAVLGGETTRPFAVALIVGIGIGTYSSLFFASPALVAWERWGRRA